MAKVGGRLKREEQTFLPPKIQKAFVAYANGATWGESAKIAGTSTDILRQWRQHPLAADYIQTAVDLNVKEAHSKFADAAPRLADRLIHLALDPNVRAYAQITVISECFKIHHQAVIDKENREELKKIRQALDQLEGGRPPDVIDVEST